MTSILDYLTNNNYGVVCDCDNKESFRLLDVVDYDEVTKVILVCNQCDKENILWI